MVIVAQALAHGLALALPVGMALALVLPVGMLAPAQEPELELD